MKLKTNSVLGTFAMVFLLIVLVAALTGCGPGTEYTKSSTQSHPQKYADISAYVTCLNGVEYWVINPGSTHGRAITPKYSPGKATPDECSELCIGFLQFARTCFSFG